MLRDRSIGHAVAQASSARVSSARFAAVRLAAVRLAVVLALTGLWLVPAAQAHEGHDHEGHDHGDKSPAALTVDEGTRFAAQSGDFELVAVPDGTTLLIRLDSLDSNEPVSGAQIRVGTVDEGMADAAREASPGLYRVPAEWARAPGRHPLSIIVRSGDRQAEFSGALIIPSPVAASSSAGAGYPGWLRGGALAGLGFGIALAAFRSGRERLGGAVLAVLMSLVLLATGASGHEAEPEPSAAQPSARADPAPHRHPDGSVFLAKAAQQLLGVRTLRAQRTEEALRTETYGRVLADPNASARVQAGRDGRIEAPPGGFLLVGQAVQQGQLLAYLVPTLTSTEEFSLRQSLVQIERDMALLVPRADAVGTVNPNMPMSDAAASVLQELQIQSQALTRQKEAVLAALNQRIEITAPIGGLISGAPVTAGQIAAARDTLFEIVDRSAALVQGWSFDADAPGAIADATAVTESGRELKLRFVGRGRVLQQQAVPLLFRVIDGADAVDIGAAVRILIVTATKTEGIALPAAAVTRGAGNMSLVWEHTTPESFVPHPVKVSPLDADRVLVNGDIAPRARIVVDGAALLNQVR
jgi:hypothetical protein